MSMTTAQRKAIDKYKAKNISRIALDVKKEEKEKIKQYAEANGETLNGFIKRAINEAMQDKKL